MSLPAPDIQARIRAELRPGETVTWSGQPDPARLMRAGFLAWLFFVPWTAFALFWTAGAAGFKFPDFSTASTFQLLFPLWGLPFVAIGIGGMSAPWLAQRKALNTIYVITNQRALSIEGGKSVTVRSYLAADLGVIERTERPDGSGDLILFTRNERDSDGDTRKRKEGFLAVANVRKVEEMIGRLKSAPRS